VIARLWRGWTLRADADAYERFLREHMFERSEHFNVAIAR
jgi:hypothetical protein